MVFFPSEKERICCFVTEENRFQSKTVLWLHEILLLFTLKTKTVKFYAVLVKGIIKEDSEIKAWEGGLPWLLSSALLHGVQENGRGSMVQEMDGGFWKISCSSLSHLCKPWSKSSGMLLLRLPYDSDLFFLFTSSVLTSVYYYTFFTETGACQHLCRCWAAFSNELEPE